MIRYLEMFIYIYALRQKNLYQIYVAMHVFVWPHFLTAQRYIQWVLLRLIESWIGMLYDALFAKLF